MKKILNKIQIPVSFIFGYLGVIAAVFIPIAILLLENGVETRIDRLVIINNLLNFRWFFSLFFILILLAILKAPLEKKKATINKILDSASLVISFALLVCSAIICINTITWLNDVSVSLSSDTSFTSNPTLDSSLPMNRDGFLAVRPEKISEYKKKTRISYIKEASSAREQELRWEILLNDADTYKYEGGNDLWIYIREYYLFLSSIKDHDKDVALRGFENINAHVKDIGSSVDDHTDCSYVASTLFQLKTEETDWQARLWAGLVGRYMAVALTDTTVHEDTRTCWLGSLPEYLSEKELDVGGDDHLKLLANALRDSFNSFEVQNSQSHAIFYSDVPQYIVDFYTALSDSKDAESFYDYMKNMKK